jgi:carbon storage regulator
MLVLSRRPQEGIRVGADVRIVVLAVSGDHVRIGIEAPECKSILRDEVFTRVALANGEAADHARPPAPPVYEEERD